MNTTATPPVKHYADSAELERLWAKWIDTKDSDAWRLLQEGIYKICQGVATQFNPQNEEEHTELSHETFALTMDKIGSGRLVFQPGKAPVFNLLTTTIFRHLYSLKNKQSRRAKLLLTKYVMQSGILNKITDDRPELAKNILLSRRDPIPERSENKIASDGSKYITDPLDFINNDTDYKLVALAVRKRKSESFLSIQLLRAKSRIKRNIEVYGDYASFLYELIDLLGEPERYTFACGVTNQQKPIEVQCKWVEKDVGDIEYRFLHIVFSAFKIAITIEQSRIDGFVAFISKFIGTLGSKPM